MMVTLLGHWRWQADPESGEGCWSAPEGCLGSIDLASLAQIEESKPGQPRGVGLFLCDNIPDGWEGAVLATDDPREARPGGKSLDAWESLTGYRPKGETLAEWLWDHLTIGADPASLDRCAPLMPQHDLRVPLWLGPKIAEMRFAIDDGSAYSDIVQDVLTRQLAAYQDQEDDPAAAQRAADALVEKYAGFDPRRKAELFDLLKPADFEGGLLPHETTYTESFTAANGTAISALTAGWISDFLNDVEATVQSNRCQNAASGGSGSENVYRYPSDLSGADHYTQCSVVQRGNGSANPTLAGACLVRKISSSTRTYYQGGVANTTANVRIHKCVSGTFTQLGSDASVTVSLPQTQKLTISGSSLELFYAGVSKISLTDTSISGHLRTGFRLNNGNTNTIIDDWEAGDLSAPAGGPFPHFTRRCLTGGLLTMNGGGR